TEDIILTLRASRQIRMDRTRPHVRSALFFSLLLEEARRGEPIRAPPDAAAQESRAVACPLVGQKECRTIPARALRRKFPAKVRDEVAQANRDRGVSRV